MSNDPAFIAYRAFQLHPTLLGEPLPQAISFETTNHCNLRCTHCGHTQFAPFVKGYLDEGLFDKLARHLGPGKIPAVGLSDFGEPFMSKRWWNIFDRARAVEGLGISFITNAVLLDRHLDKLDHPGLNIAISMDGASEPTYAHFRGAGYFEHVVGNLRQLRARESSGALPASHRSFIVVLSQRNVHEMPALVELAAELGVRALVFSFQVFFNEERFRNESLFFARARYDRGLREALQRAAALGVDVLHPSAFDDAARNAPAVMSKSWLWRDLDGRIRCGAIYSSCYVKFHGQIEACCVPDRHPLGNLNEDSFVDIWHGPYYRRLRQSFHTGCWTAPCQNCNLFQSVDVGLQQSHFLTPMRDDGGLISMPQPYRISELDTRYRELLVALQRQPEQPAAIMPRLLKLATVDERLHEVANAIAVIWTAVGQRDKGLRVLRQAAGLAPEDPVIAHNLAVSTADTAACRSR